MRYIESPSNDAFYNMALEEYVFESLPRDDSYFMLWQNRNAVVVGKFQNTAQEVDAAFVRRQGIDVVRRLSGGGAMYQDMGNLNFTFVVDQQDSRNLDFGLFIDPVICALARLGVRAEKSGRNDILVDGKKFSGNAQYNKKGRTMHHGTLLFRSDLAVVGKALRVRPDKIESKGIRSVRSRVVNLSDYLPKEVALADFKAALLDEMFGAGPRPEYRLTAEDDRAVGQLRDEKYATFAWNYGRSPAYSIHKDCRYPFGSVELALEVRDGHIRDIGFWGDFFGNGDPEELAQKLAGAALQQQDIRRALDGVDVGRYISGMDTDMLVELLTL